MLTPRRRCFFALNLFVVALKILLVLKMSVFVVAFAGLVCSFVFVSKVFLLWWAALPSRNMFLLNSINLRSLTYFRI